jgi:hypothetical protein
MLPPMIVLVAKEMQIREETMAIFEAEVALTMVRNEDKIYI